MPPSVHKVSFEAISNVGKVRRQNQDAWQIIPEKNLFVVADGVGSKKYGGLAALEAIDFVTEFADRIDPMHLDTALIEANDYLFQKNHHKRYLKQLATTLTLLMLKGKHAFFSHVGDTRLYLFRNNELIQLTNDHCLGNDLVLQGKLSLKEMSRYPYKNYLTQTLGLRAKIKPSQARLEVCSNDLFLLCSDGLSNYCSQEYMQKALFQNQLLPHKADHLVKLAKEGGGGDNITLILIQIH